MSKSPAIRALLVSANTEQGPYPVYPLALDTLRAPLEEHGIEVGIWDALWGQGTGVTLADQLAAFRPDVVLLTMRNVDNIDSINTRGFVGDIAACVANVRAHGSTPIALGGSGFSLFPEKILERTGADVGLTGAGEPQVVALVEALATGRSIAHLPGAVYRDGDTIVAKPPVPATGLRGIRQHHPGLLEYYWKIGGIPGVQLSRGCPLNCVYCTYPILEGRKRIGKKALEAADEMQNAYESHGVNRFFLVDSVCNLNPRQLDILSEELIERKLDVRWSGYFSPLGLTEERLARWQRAGLEEVELGLDTLAESLLPKWGKKFTPEQADTAVAACEKLGLSYVCHLILGGPGETLDTLDETAARIDRYAKAAVYACVGMRVYPGTSLWETAVAEGVLGKDEDLLEPRFYRTSEIDPEAFAARCDALGQRRNWVVTGRSLEAKLRIAAMLRRHGAKGACWEELCRA